MSDKEKVDIVLKKNCDYENISTSYRVSLGEINKISKSEGPFFCGYTKQDLQAMVDYCRLPDEVAEVLRGVKDMLENG